MQGGGQFNCDLCSVQCNSDVNLRQHLASKKHLARAARSVWPAGWGWGQGLARLGLGLPRAARMGTENMSCGVGLMVVTYVVVLRAASADVEAAAKELQVASTIGKPAAITYVGPNAVGHNLCK